MRDESFANEAITNSEMQGRGASATLTGYFFELLGVDVEIRVDVLHVVMVF